MKRKINNWVMNLKVMTVLAGALVLALVLAAGDAFALEYSVQNKDGRRYTLNDLPVIYAQTEVLVHDQMTAAKHSFQFENKTQDQLEVDCKVYMDRDEVVDGFAYWNGSEKIVGQAIEKKAAAAVYQKLTGVRKDPGLLERHDEYFRFRIFPVEIGEIKPVELSSIRALETVEGVIEYVIPHDNLPGKGAVYSLSMDITDDLPIVDIETEGFQGLIRDLGPNHKQVVFETDKAEFTGDLVVRYRLQADDYSLRLVTHKEKGRDGTFMLIASPKTDVQESDVIGRDIVFVMDSSGSMSGTPWEQTQRALTYLLERLNPDDRYDVVVFDNQPRAFYGNLVEASDDNIQDSVDVLQGLSTGGGTNIKDALLVALDELTQKHQSRPRAIIFLTDGVGNNPREVVLAQVAKKSEGVRIFAFGAGNGINRNFLSRLASENRGIATFIRTTDKIESDVKRLYDRIAVPLMVDLEIEFDGLNVHSIYPDQLPDLYRDGQVVLFGRYSKGDKGRITLAGNINGAEYQVTMKAKLPDEQSKYAMIEKLWACDRVESLMDMIRLRGENDEWKNEIIKLGVVYDLATEYTSFIAVPEALQTKKIKEEMEKGKKGHSKNKIDSYADVKANQKSGVNLSLVHIPPGDPVLSVKAPKDALRVTAYFPFGLVKKLKWDNIRGHWSVRFLVPRNVEDGIYQIKIKIEMPDGSVRFKTIEYVIDATSPEFKVKMDGWAAQGSTLPILIDPYEEIYEAFAYVPEAKKGRVKLTLDSKTGFYAGDLDVPAKYEQDHVIVRIVVRDLARNRCERDFLVRTFIDDDIDTGHPPYYSNAQAMGGECTMDDKNAAIDDAAKDELNLFMIAMAEVGISGGIAEFEGVDANKTEGAKAAWSLYMALGLVAATIPAASRVRRAKRKGTN